MGGELWGGVMVARAGWVVAPGRWFRAEAPRELEHAQREIVAAYAPKRGEVIDAGACSRALDVAQ